jgi:glycine dehydrogenase subunit 1
MTMQTREQHIRRAKATSNICSNEGLCALAAVTYLAWLGGNGLESLSYENFTQGQYFARQISSLPSFSKRFSGSHFNECVIHSAQDPYKVNSYLLQQGIQGGIVLAPWYPSLQNELLFGVTELHSKQDIDHFISVLREVNHV